MSRVISTPVHLPAHHYHPFVRRLATALRRRCRVRQGARLLLAVSGGADSMALLHAMALLAPKRTWGLTLVVAHVQHHLRPNDEAEGDALAVARAAHRLGLLYLRADLDLSACAGNVESLARGGRYDALVKLAKSFRAEAIVTAHHADDQLETLLMRLLRGASLQGLSSIPWRRGISRECGVVLMRPMLHHTRAEAEEFLRECGAEWRTDATNGDVSRLRAKLRRDVTPVLTAIAPRAALRGARAADELRRAAKLERVAVKLAARAAVKREAGEVVIDRAEARALPASLLASLLHQELDAAGVQRDRLTGAVIGGIVRAMRDRKGGTRRFSLGRGCEAVLTRDALRVPVCRVGFGVKPP